MTDPPDPFTGLPAHLVEEHNEAMARAQETRRDRFERRVSDFGRALGNTNDRLYGGCENRWHKRRWRFVDRIAGRLYVYGER